LSQVKAASHSSSKLLTSLLNAAEVRGAVLGRHELRFGDYVVSLTRPGSPRMPNGIECRVSIKVGGTAAIGAGRVVIGRIAVDAGPGWDPVPVFDPIDSLPPGPRPSGGLCTWTSAGEGTSDALLAGYIAGLYLLHGQRERAEQVASRRISEAGASSATLLRHAARGEVPEPVHVLLASRNASRLVSWSPSGISWLRGFVSAGLPLEPIGARIAPDRRTA